MLTHVADGWSHVRAASLSDQLTEEPFVPSSSPRHSTPLLPRASRARAAVGSPRLTPLPPAMSSWDAEGLALAVDEVRALCAMYDDGDDAATGADATSVDDPSVLLDLAESALSAAFPPPGASSSSVDPLAAVPALETTVRLLGARLRGGPVAVALTFPPGFPRVARLGAHVEGNARATLAANARPGHIF